MNTRLLPLVLAFSVLLAASNVACAPRPEPKVAEKTAPPSASAGQTARTEDDGLRGSPHEGRGVLGTYGESVVSRARPSWTLPGQAKNYTAVVNLKINPDGTVRQATIVRSSGSSYIDSSIIQAVMASQLEAPPADLSDIDITFHTDALAR